MPLLKGVSVQCGFLNVPVLDTGLTQVHHYKTCMCFLKHHNLCKKDTRTWLFTYTCVSCSLTSDKSLYSSTNLPLICSHIAFTNCISLNCRSMSLVTWQLCGQYIWHSCGQDVSMLLLFLGVFLLLVKVFRDINNLYSFHVLVRYITCLSRTLFSSLHVCR